MKPAVQLGVEKHAQRFLDFERIEAAPFAGKPFPHFIATNVLSPHASEGIQHDFPPIISTGVFPLDNVTFGPAFAHLVSEMRAPAFERLIERKFGLELSGKPLMMTVRGYCAKKDGQIHTDSKDKFLTGLLYLNGLGWDQSGGRLRLLRSGSDLEDMIGEVSPEGGTLVMFKRTDNSWHGHYSFEGQRRYIMFNWMVSELAHVKNVGRHKLSASFKRFNPFS